MTERERLQKKSRGEKSVQAAIFLVNAALFVALVGFRDYFTASYFAGQKVKFWFTVVSVAAAVVISLDLLISRVSLRWTWHYFFKNKKGEIVANRVLRKRTTFAHFCGQARESINILVGEMDEFFEDDSVLLALLEAARRGVSIIIFSGDRARFSQEAFLGAMREYNPRFLITLQEYLTCGRIKVYCQHRRRGHFFLFDHDSIIRETQEYGELSPWLCQTHISLKDEKEFNFIYHHKANFTGFDFSALERDYRCGHLCNFVEFVT